MGSLHHIGYSLYKNLLAEHPLNRKDNQRQSKHHQGPNAAKPCRHGMIPPFVDDAINNAAYGGGWLGEALASQGQLKSPLPHEMETHF